MKRLDPEYVGDRPNTYCQRGCCWTPYQVCAKKKTCSCHWRAYA